ncbi:MAG: ferrous iron transport protein B [Flavobacteriales bacterium]|nr:ferrous iron transport protein B [Flavobacteriales bacterium]
MKDSDINIVLAGNPNSGKTTLFNSLTGLKQKVGNYPGITVEKKTAKIVVNDFRSKLIDLPGIYSLYSKSIDEKVAQNVICNSYDSDYADVIVVIADASNLRRSIFLLTQIIDLKIPVVLALNMIDVASKKGVVINIDQLSSEMGIKVVAINARKARGLSKLKKAIIETNENASNETPTILDVNDVFGKIIKVINSIRNINNDYASFLSLCGYDMGNSIKQKVEISILSKNNEIIVERLQAKETVRRYKVIDKIISICVRNIEPKGKYKITKIIDDILIHPFFGYVIFLAILFLMFQAVFLWSKYPMDLIEGFFMNLSIWVAEILPSGVLNDLLVNGILAGIGGILVFIPQIALLFAFIAFLEDTGYMARVSFLTDKLLKGVGLNGRAIIPLLSGVGCAIPAIMSARTISSWKERIITIMVTPLMSCAARLPVYSVIINLIIPENVIFGFIELQGLVLMSFYLLGFISAMLIAFILKFIINTSKKSFFIMEMPSYKIPDWKTVIYTIIEKVKIFFFDAGKIIVAISVILWLLSSYGPGNNFQEIENRWVDKENAGKYIAAEKLEYSYAGIIGKTIEPVIKPLGFDWKIGISLITSIAAREAFVGTMSTIYSVGDDSVKTLENRMKSEINQETGKAFYTTAVGISLMLFYAFAMQCMSTIAIVYRETNSIKWPVIQFLYLTFLAYLSSFLAYQILS